MPELDEMVEIEAVSCNSQWTLLALSVWRE
jgi:hypothetical protein